MAEDKYLVVLGNEKGVYDGSDVDKHYDELKQAGAKIYRGKSNGTYTVSTGAEEQNDWTKNDIDQYFASVKRDYPDATYSENYDWDQNEYVRGTKVGSAQDAMAGADSEETGLPQQVPTPEKGNQAKFEDKMQYAGNVANAYLQNTSAALDRTKKIVNPSQWAKDALNANNKVLEQTAAPTDEQKMEKDMAEAQRLQRRIAQDKALKREGRKSDDKALRSGAKVDKKETEEKLKETLTRLDTNPAYLEKLKTESDAVMQDKANLAMLASKAYKEGGNTMGFTGTTGNTTYLATRSDDAKNIDAANRMYDDALKAINAPLKYDESKGVANWFRGMKDDMNDIDYWTFGITEIGDNGALRNALLALDEQAGKLDDNAFENLDDYDLSDSQKALINAYVTLQSAKILRSMDTSTGYKGGMGSAESLSFMAQMAATGGLGRAASKGIVKALSKAMGKTLKNMAPKTFAGAAGKWAVKQTSKLGISAIESLTKAGVMTLAQPGTYANIAERGTQVNDTGHLDYLGKITAQGGFDSFVETVSEMSGGAVGKVIGGLFEGAAKALRYAGKTAMLDVMRNASARAFASKAGTLLKGTKGMMQVGWNQADEWMEEVIGGAMRDIAYRATGGYLGDSGNNVSEFFEVQNLAETAANFAAMSIIGTAAGGVKVGQTIHYENKFKKDVEKLDGILGKVPGFKEFINTHFARISSRSQNMSARDAYETTSRDMASELANFYAKMANQREAEGNPMTAEEKMQVFSAMTEYMKDYATVEAINGLLDAANKIDNDAAVSSATQQAGGKNIQYEGKTEFAGNEIVVGVMPDGSRVFIKGDLNGNGQYPAIEANGGRAVYVDASILQDRITYAPGTFGLDIADEKKAADEAQRMDAERLGQGSAVREQFEQTYPVQTEIDQQTMASIFANIGKQPIVKKAYVDSTSDDGVLVAYEDGTSELIKWEYIAPLFGGEINVKTDEQIANDEAAQLDAESDAKDIIGIKMRKAIENGVVLQDSGEQIIDVLPRTINLQDGTAVVLLDYQGEKRWTRIDYSDIDKRFVNTPNGEIIDTMPTPVETPMAPASTEVPAAVAESTPAEQAPEVAEQSAPKGPQTDDEWEALLDSDPIAFAKAYTEANGGSAEDTKAVLKARLDKLNKKITTVGDTSIGSRLALKKKIDAINAAIADADNVAKKASAEAKAKEDAEKARIEREAKIKDVFSKLEKITSDPNVFFNQEHNTKSMGKVSFTFADYENYINLALDRLDELNKSFEDGEISSELASAIESRMNEFLEMRDIYSYVTSVLPDVNLANDVKVSKSELYPRTPAELAAYMLSKGMFRISRESYAKELGYGANSKEAKDLRWMLSKKGISIQAAAEMLEQEANEGTDYEGEKLPDTMAWRDALIGLLQSVKGIYDIYGYIRNNRKAEKRDYNEQTERDLSAIIERDYGVTLDEYEAQLDDVRKNYLLNMLDLPHGNTNFTHNENKVENGHENAESTAGQAESVPANDTGNAAAGNTAGGNVLQEEQPAVPDTAGEKQGETGVRTGNGANELLDGNGEKGSGEVEAQKTDDTFGSNNTVVTKERAEEIKKKLLAKLKGQLNSGFDPEVFGLGCELAAFYIEAGTRKFVDFAKKMVEDLTDAIKPYLKSIYNGARDLPGMEEIAKDMDSAEYVTNFDINKLNDTENGTEGTNGTTDVLSEGGSEEPGASVSDDTGEGADGESGGVRDTDGGNTGGNDETGDAGNGENTVGEGHGDMVGGEKGEGELGEGTEGERPEQTDGTGEEGGVAGGRKSGNSTQGVRTGVGRPFGGRRRTGTDVEGIPGTGTESIPGLEEKPELTDAELGDIEKAETEKVAEEIKSSEDVLALKARAEGIKKKISEAEDRSAEKARLEGELKAVNARLREIFANKKEIKTDISSEKVAYVSVSDPEGKHSMPGTVVPSGSAESMRNALKAVEEREGKPIAEYVKEKLGYKSLDEMFTDFGAGKTVGLSSEQVDAVGLAISNMEHGRSLIIGDMTGIGKGREGAAIVRWAKRNKKKVLYVTDKPDLFTDVYRDLKDIGSDDLKPLCIGDTAKSVIKDPDTGKILVPAPSSEAKKALFKSGSDSLDITVRRKAHHFDFVCTTYSQGREETEDSAYRNASTKDRCSWILNYAKDAIVILDESHLAGGNSSQGSFFQKIVDAAEGVTFMSATYAKTPENMYLYAKKSSIKDTGISDASLIKTIKDFGVPMQELLAESLFASGEMIRRERDMTGVEVVWEDPKKSYTQEEHKVARDTFDSYIKRVGDIIDFQRTIMDPIIDKMNDDEFKEDNKLTEKTGDGWIKEYTYSHYKQQAGRIVNLITYAIKIKKAADVAVEQLKKGEKPVIVVDNTMESYIKEISELGVDDATLVNVIRKGLERSMKYTLVAQKHENGKPVKKRDGGLVKTPMGSIYSELSGPEIAEADSIAEEIEKLLTDTGIEQLPLSPIDYIQERIREAGYSCGEITGRTVGLERGLDGKWHKKSITQDKRGSINRFNGGTKRNPLPKDQQFDAIVLNSAGATGVSLHSSAGFGNQDQRHMNILQPSQDINVEVQIRGRIDRTGQVKRGKYVYSSSPVPAERKMMMATARKLASLDANSVGTEKVSSNRVDAEDMENEYGDRIAVEYLKEHLGDINEMLGSDGLRQDEAGVYVPQSDQMHLLMNGLQLLPCDTQEEVIKELEERYIALIEYLNENGINNLESTVLNLDAERINGAIMVQGVDNMSPSRLLHDTIIERVMVNVLKKPLQSPEVRKEMKRLGSLDENDKIVSGYGDDVIKKVKAKIAEIVAGQKEAAKQKEDELIEKLKQKNPMPKGEDPESYDTTIHMMPQYLDLVSKNKIALCQKVEVFDANLQEIIASTMYFAPGSLMCVPITDDYSREARFSYGRFIGFKLGDAKPRSVKAVFAVRDSRAKIELPVADMPGIAWNMASRTGDDDRISGLGRNMEMDERMELWDKTWDAMTPKNTARQKRYMVTGNVVVASEKLGKHKGRMVTFTRKNSETGEITVDRGMLLAEDFDPKKFYIKRYFSREEIWDTDRRVRDKSTGIETWKSGDILYVQFNKRNDEHLSEHPAYKDKKLAGLALGGSIEYKSRDFFRLMFEEKNVDELLEYLKTKYGFGRQELFQMPDDPDRPDRIVPTGMSAETVINTLGTKYGVKTMWSVESAIKNAMKQYDMDAGNEELIQKIRELVQLRQALYRKQAASEDNETLAWNVLIQDDTASGNADDSDDPDALQTAINKREAYLEELEFRGVKGRSLSLVPGDVEAKFIEDLFWKLNSDKTNAEIAKRVFAAAKKAKINFTLNPKTARNGGAAGGANVNYNWKFMNAQFISDQMKANTILHEIVHSLTVYAITAVSNGEEHLIGDEMTGRVNDIKNLYRILRFNSAFDHTMGESTYTDYGMTNYKELLTELASNEQFRNDMEKVEIAVTMMYGQPSFKIADEHTPTANRHTAKELAMEALNYLINNFNPEAYREVWRGSAGGASYMRDSKTSLLDSILSEAKKNERYSYDTKSIAEKTDAGTIKQVCNTIADALGSKVVFEDNAASRARRIDGKLVEPMGWYGTETGIVHINMNRVQNVEAAAATMLHETVGHFGLRAMCGDKFDKFLDGVYESANGDIKSDIDKIVSELKLDKRKATEEYLAMIAEEGFDDADDAKFFTRVKNLFLNMLKAIGISFKNILTDEDLKYILWQSKRNLEKGDIVSNAKKALTRSQLRKDAENSHNKKTGKTPPDGGKGSNGGERYGFSVSPREYRIVSNQIFTYPEKISRAHVFTDNNYYLCDNIDDENGTFDIVATLPINGNEEFINSIKAGDVSTVKAIGTSEALSEFIGAVRSRGGRVGRNIPLNERRYGRNGRYASVDVRQSSKRGRDTEGIGEDSEGQAIDNELNMLVYHGSGANFERFDHNFMGDGQGAQSYGWGSYVSSNPDTAKGYMAIGRNDAVDAPEYFNKFNGHMPRGEKQMLAALNLTRHYGNVQGTIDDITNQVQNAAIDLIRGNKTLEDRFQLVKDTLKYIEQIRDGKVRYEYSGKRKNFYTVEIPDDNGFNYLHWDEPLTKAQTKAIVDGLIAQYGDRLREDYDDQLESVLMSTFGPETKGSQVEGALNYYLGNEKNFATGEDKGAERNSKFLNSVGFAGMQVPVARATGYKYPGSNYVLYNDKDLEIKGHEMYSFGLNTPPRFKRRTIPERQKLFDAAVKQYGLTEDFREAGYILPNGDMLDFSEKRDGGPVGQRTQDHRNIRVVFDDTYDSATAYMLDFMNEGAVRMLPESAGFNIIQPLTESQMAALRKYIRKHNGEVIVEISDENGYSTGYKEYGEWTEPGKIFSDISSHFAGYPLSQEDAYESGEMYSFGIGHRYRNTRSEKSKVSKAVKNIVVTNEIANAARHFYNVQVGRPSVLLREQYVQQYEAVFKAMEGIELESGKKASSSEDFRLAASALPMKNKHDKDVYREKHLNPMLAAVKALVDKEGADITYDDVVEYVELKHGIERNMDMAKKSAMADYVNEYERKRVPLLEDISRLQKKMQNLLGDNSLEDLSDDKFEKYEDARLQIEGLNEELDNLKEELENHRRVLYPEEYYKKYYEEKSKEFRRSMDMDPANQADLLMKIAALDEWYKNITDELETNPKKFEKIREKDARYAHYRGIDNEENMGTDFSAIRSWFAEYVDADGNPIFETPERHEGWETEDEYLSRLSSMRRVPESAKKLAGAEQMAQEWIDSFEEKAGAELTDNLWSEINGATQAILDHQLKYHMISREQHDKLSKRFKYYVPLRGFAEKTAEDMWFYGDEDHSKDFAAPLLPMQGRQTKPAAPFAYIGSMFDSANTQDHKNELIRYLYRFVMNRKDNSLITIADSWYRMTGNKDEAGREIWEPMYPQNGQSADEFEKEMMGLASMGMAVKGSRGVNLRGAVVHIDPKNRDKHLVRVMDMGKEKFLVVNGNPRAALALNGGLNIETLTNNAALKFMRSVTRFQAMMNTGASPSFWVANFAKDFWSGAINTIINEDASYLANYEKCRAEIMMLAIPIIMRGGGYSPNPKHSGKLQARAKRLADLYKVYVENGGPTGFSTVSNVEEYEDIVSRLTKKGKGDTLSKVQSAWDAFMKVGRIGEALEQVPRFAAFITSYHYEGRSLEQSIRDAKDVTLDFNTKGAASGATMDYIKTLEKMKRNGSLRKLNALERIAVWWFANASPFARSLYMFFNPAVQGVDKFIRNIKGQPGKAATVMAMVVAAGFLRSMIASMFGDPDDDDNYNAIGGYRKRNNIILNLGAIDILWPFSQEYAPLYAIGDIIAEGILKNDGPEDNLAFDAAEAAASIMPINPMNLMELMPSLVRPIVEVLINKDYKGGEIYHKWDSNAKMPGYTKAPDATWTWLVEASADINRMTGGSRAKQGSIDINPAIVQHLIEGIGGGVLRDAGNTLQTIESIIGPDAYQFREDPILRRFILKPEEYKNAFVYDKYYQFKAVADEAKRLMKEYEKDPAGLDDPTNTWEYKIYEVFENYSSDINSAKQALKNANADKAGKNEIEMLQREGDAVKAEIVNKCMNVYHKR